MPEIAPFAARLIVFTQTRRRVRSISWVKHLIILLESITIAGCGNGKTSQRCKFWINHETL